MAEEDFNLMWGKDDYRLVVRSDRPIPEDLLEQVQQNEPSPVGISTDGDGVQHIEYDLIEIKGDRRAPLDIIGQSILEPLRGRRIGRVVFYPVLQRFGDSGNIVIPSDKP